MLHQHLSAAPSLVFRRNGNRAECKNLLFSPGLISQPGLCIHDVSDYPAVQLKDKIQLRYEILMPAHDMDQVMFTASRHMKVIKRLPGNILHHLII